MSLKLPEILSPELALGLVAYAGLSYFVTSDQIAGRIAKADTIPVCQATVTEQISSQAEQEIDRITRPDTQAAQRDAAISTLHSMSSSDHGRFFDQLTGGAMRRAAAQAEATRRAARQAQQDAVNELRRRAEARIAQAPDLCSCMARSAYEASRTDWAIYTGTLSIFQPATVEHFLDEMNRHAASCQSGGTA